MRPKSNMQGDAVKTESVRVKRSEAARQLGVNESAVREWVHRYREHGELAFLDTGRNHV